MTAAAINNEVTFLDFNIFLHPFNCTFILERNKPDKFLKQDIPDQIKMVHSPSYFPESSIEPGDSTAITNSSMEKPPKVNNTLCYTNNDDNKNELKAKDLSETNENESSNHTSSDVSSDEMPAALDLSVCADKSYLDIDSSFDRSFTVEEEEEEEEENSIDDNNFFQAETPNYNTNALFETPFVDKLAATSDSFLLATPPVPSPRKSSNIYVPSSRVVSGSLKIMKRRKVGSPTHTTAETSSLVKEENQCLTNSPSPRSPQHLRITPSKSRSFSTPLPNPKLRVPSLQDKPIPVLSLPSPTNPNWVAKDMSARSVSQSFVSPLSSFKTPMLQRRNSSDLGTLPGSSDSFPENSVFASPKKSDTNLSPNKLQNSKLMSQYTASKPDESSKTGQPRSVSQQLSPPTLFSPLRKSPTKQASSVHISPIKADMNSSVQRSSNTFSAPRKTPVVSRITAPFHRPQKNSKTAALSTKESILDQRILQLRKQIDIVNLAQSYKDSNQDVKLAELEEKWRDVAQKGASFLYNQARIKVDRMGGMKEFLRRKKEDEESFEEMQRGGEDSIDLDEMNEEQREQYLLLKAEYEEELELDKRAMANANKSDDDLDEFTMKYMLNTLKVDYNLVFPEDYDTE